MAILERDVVRPGANTAGGGHLAYIPGSSLYHAALGDFFAAVTNKYAGIFFSAPGAVRMENMLLRWTADLVGYPSGAGGTRVGGSIANLTAITTARDAHGLREPYANPSCTQSQAHHCIAKALRTPAWAKGQLATSGRDGSEEHRRARERRRGSPQGCPW